MSTTFWFMLGQTVVFLAVCGFALWAARLLAEAAENSALAAEQASKAAQDAEGTAADIREMRDMLRAWLDEQQTRADLRNRQQTLAGSPTTGRGGTDTAEAHAVLTPWAIIERGPDTDPARTSPRDSARSQRGRHARATVLPWTTALRAATSRASRDR